MIKSIIKMSFKKCKMCDKYYLGSTTIHEIIENVHKKENYCYDCYKMIRLISDTILVNKNNYHYIALKYRI